MSKNAGYGDADALAMARSLQAEFSGGSRQNERGARSGRGGGRAGASGGARLIDRAPPPLSMAARQGNAYPGNAPPSTGRGGSFAGSGIGNMSRQASESDFPAELLVTDFATFMSQSNYANTTNTAGQGSGNTQPTTSVRDPAVGPSTGELLGPKTLVAKPSAVYTPTGRQQMSATSMSHGTMPSTGANRSNYAAETLSPVPGRMTAAVDANAQAFRANNPLGISAATTTTSTGNRNAGINQSRFATSNAENQPPVRELTFRSPSSVAQDIVPATANPSDVGPGVGRMPEYRGYYQNEEDFDKMIEKLRVSSNTATTAPAKDETKPEPKPVVGYYQNWPAIVSAVPAPAIHAFQTNINASVPPRVGSTVSSTRSIDMAPIGSLHGMTTVPDTTRAPSCENPLSSITVRGRPSVLVKEYLAKQEKAKREGTFHGFGS